MHDVVYDLLQVHYVFLLLQYVITLALGDMSGRPRMSANAHSTGL